MHFTTFPEKTQLHFYLQTSIYHLQTPLKNYLTSATPENSNLAATCLMCFCVKATDQPPPFFYSFWPLGRAFLLGGLELWEGGGLHLSFSFCLPPLLFISLDNWAEEIFSSWQVSHDFEGFELAIPPVFPLPW